MHPWEDWRSGYAARRDLGGGVHHTICHPFDYLRMLFGDPTGVVASLTQDGPLGLDVAEAADVILRFRDGVTAQLHLDYWSQPAMHRVEVVCAGGTIRWDYLAGEFQLWDNATAAWNSEEYPGLSERNDLFVSEARHFLDVVSGDREPVCTLADGIEVVRLCAATEQSVLRSA
jgi:predicted dehydrogenase